ncbi:YopX family protein [Paenibacillus sp. Lou8.1]|uniref:YopX family protein n=1 Tax=Paenibacillus sp. Lou8.1 TaxID=2962041 RepID=UPI0020B67DF8|nr:YopX family protein [Paenibacillus sp. Lou8.1]MCP3806433.1 YopX family protein [Paenibacillus sp. Lou8.1]
MRDIKFRGKRLDNGEWVFGDIWQHNGRVDIVDHRAQSYPVDPETVGQYAGLPDREGEDIYEDYILDGSYKNPMSGEIVKRHYKVTYKKGGFYAEMIGHHPFGTTLLYFENENAVVIGNIHDNPELLQPQGGGKGE